MTPLLLLLLLLYSYYYYYSYYSYYSYTPTTPTTPTATPTPTTSNFNKHSRKLQTSNPEALLSKSFRAAHALNEAGREAIVALSWGTLEFTV